MIKTISFILMILCSAVFAASFNDNVTSLIEKQTGVKIKIIKTENLKSNKDLKLLIVEIVDNSQQIPLFVTKDGGMVIGLSNISFTNSSEDEEIIVNIANEAMVHNDNIQKQAAGDLIKQLKPEQYITLKSSASNPKTYFIVADPNCGYCREEIRNLDDKLKTHNVNLVIVGMLGEDSLKKAAYLMDKINSQMSENDKMNGIKEVFSQNFKAPKNIDTSKVKETTDLLFKTGVIRGTPYIYEQ